MKSTLLDPEANQCDYAPRGVPPNDVPAALLQPRLVWVEVQPGVFMPRYEVQA